MFAIPVTFDLTLNTLSIVGLDLLNFDVRCHAATCIENHKVCFLFLGQNNLENMCGKLKSNQFSYDFTSAL